MSPWQPDLKNGTYKNPVLNADYSDPDAIRVGDDYWMTSSSFCHVPGLPILHSRDLVNWTLVNHALPALVPGDVFSVPQHGKGVWAPAFRYHAGKFWIYYPDPDFGIYVITTEDPRGKWSDPIMVKAGRGLIDPCPLWDDNSDVFLVHGWAKSRAGISNILTVHRMSPDGTCVVDEGRVVIDGNKMEGWTTIEGPKFYKRDGWYFIFAPAGGVATGYQAIFRSRSIWGPYESRVTLAQGATPINGPHQGAWVDTSSGEHWFLHFQEVPAMGRVVHLQPMSWASDGWPLMGTAVAAGKPDVKGEPVLVHKKPGVKAPQPSAAPATSDDFSSPKLGLQWQWQANPRSEWMSLDAARKSIRLACMPMADGVSHWMTPQLLMQKFPSTAFSATVGMHISSGLRVGDHAGLMVFGYDYAWIGLRVAAVGKIEIVHASCHKAMEGNAEKVIAAVHVLQSGCVYVRVSVTNGNSCQFAWSSDGGKTFAAMGGVFYATLSKWVGAKVGIFAASSHTLMPAPQTAFADFTDFRVSAA